MTIAPANVIDEWGQVVNTPDAAKWVSLQLATHGGIAFSFSLGNMTRYEISFIQLARIIPMNVLYTDGSSRGTQINIDRHGSYGLPLEGGGYLVPEYIAEKWNVSLADARALSPFFSSVLTGENKYE